jgi:hypothetical protein
VIDKYPIRTAAREMRRLERLGDGPLVCVLCEYVDPVALIPVTEEWLRAKGVPSSLFEDDHVVGRAHDPKFIFPICRNCHAVLTEDRLRAGVSMRPAPDQNTRDVLRLEGLAVFHEKTAEALRRWAAEKRSKGPND